MKPRSYITIVLALLSLSLGTAVYLGTPTALPRAHAVSRTISLSGSFATGWNGTNPGPTMTLIEGDTVTLHLVSADGAPHTFIIDVAHAGVVSSPNCSVDKCSTQFSSSTTFQFTVDMASGTYTYYCSIHLQHMTGRIVVQSSANTTPDFSATANPTTLSIDQGSTGTATLTLASLNGFTGTVALTVSVSPSGPAVSLSPTMVTLPSDGSMSSALSISAASGGLYSSPVSSGAYTVTITETSGSTSHKTAVMVNIGSTPSGSTSSMPANPSTSSGVLLLVIAIVVVVAVAGTAAVLLRNSRRN